MHQADFEEHVGAGNIRASISEALQRAATIFPRVEQREACIHWERRSTDAPELVTDAPEKLKL